MVTKYTNEKLSEAVKNNISVAGVMRHMGIQYISGGMHSHISSRIKATNLDTSHFTGQASNNGGRTSKQHWTKILIKRVLDRREHTYKLRRAMIECGIEYKCNKCNLSNRWQDQELKIQINHISGDPLDNRKENLEFLCPNCHSQTPTWGSKQIAKKSKPNKNTNLCIDCKKNISRKALRCRGCAPALYRKTKINWPPDLKLLDMLKQSSFVSVGKQLGVSDNAIRKRLKRRNCMPG